MTKSFIMKYYLSVQSSPLYTSTPWQYYAAYFEFIYFLWFMSAPNCQWNELRCFSPRESWNKDGQRKKRMAYKEAVTGWWEVEWKRARVSAARPHHRAHYLCGRKLDLCEGEHNSTGGRKDGENTRLWRWMPPRVLVGNNNRSRRGSARAYH